MGLTANEIKTMLGLERHPTCGFVAETYRSPLRIPTWALPDAYESSRPFASALYFLVAPDAQIVMHRIRSDQLYHHYLGDPLEVLLLYPDGSGAIVTVGSDLASGMRPQLLVPGGTFHTSRLAPGGAGYALLASTEWPGVEPSDVEMGTSMPWRKTTRASERRSTRSREDLRLRSGEPALVAATLGRSPCYAKKSIDVFSFRC